MARHLREQSGGNPSDHGPVPELANQPASPRSKEDFPDAPETDAPSGPGGDLTDDQLRDFAARLGLRADEDDRSDEDDRAVDERDASDDRSDDRSDDTSERGGVSGDDIPDGDRRPRRVVVGRVVVRRVRRPVGRVLILVSRYVDVTGRWLRASGERIAGR